MDQNKPLFSKADIAQIEYHGLTVTTVQQHINRIKKGINYVNLVAPASANKGIIKCDETAILKYVKRFNKHRDRLQIIKFVPASGAATRMFNFLFQFLNDFDETADRLGHYLKNHKNFWIFTNGLEKLPFYKHVVAKIPNFNGLDIQEKTIAFVHTMLNENGLNYATYPKGLLPFHRHKNKTVTAFYEHLLEATLYASNQHVAHLHFTISPHHENMFKAELNTILKDVEAKTKTTFKVSFSFQNNATNAITLSTTNTIIRDDNGALIFRPAGHGALIENLNALNFDLIFIKNIDNIVVYNQNKKLAIYKKFIAGVLLEAQHHVFKYLNELDNPGILETKIAEIAGFITNRLNVILEPAFNTYSNAEKAQVLHEKLNRPLRVCGMVKNEGEPGGGPFWVKDKHGNVSLQIIEFAQINTEVMSQKKCVESATYFNPTDIVCGVKNYKNEKFNLLNYIDHDADFIVEKVQNNATIKAFELPGLWNGSMAFWNSIFVEIPVETFNPVKSVNDLLKPAHQV